MNAQKHQVFDYPIGYWWEQFNLIPAIGNCWDSAALSQETQALRAPHGIQDLREPGA